MPASRMQMMPLTTIREPVPLTKPNTLWTRTSIRPMYSRMPAKYMQIKVMMKASTMALIPPRLSNVSTPEAEIASASISGCMSRMI